MEPSYYLETLYPLQNQALAVLSGLETGFYLTGGTAASRDYLHHRFSDDLDLFVNHDERFEAWADECVQALSQTDSWRTEVLRRDTRFVRLVLVQTNTTLRVEFINDVPAHVGVIRTDPVLGRLDSAENILANKVTALIDREEPKDLADVWGFCCRMGLSLTDALGNAQSKAAGIFAPDLARVLLSATEADWRLVRWHQGPDAGQFVADLQELGERLLLVR